MIHKIKTYVTPPTVISLIALVFAVSGVSYAATGGGSGNGGSNTHSLTASTAKSKSKGKSGPRGPRGATGSAGPAGKNGATGATGATGAQGPAGAKGEAGAAGEQGKEGEEGPKGTSARPVSSEEFTQEREGHCKEGGSEIRVGSAKTYTCNGHEGKNGTFGSEPLPAGQTLKGVWAASGYDGGAEGEFAFAKTAVSFADPVMSVKIGEDDHIHYIKSGETPPAGCTGEESEPGAEPNNLCVFGGEEANVFEASPEVVSNPTVLGFKVKIVGEKPGQFSEQGTWAVTGCNPATFKPADPLGCEKEP